MDNEEARMHEPRKTSAYSEEGIGELISGIQHKNILSSTKVIDLNERKMDWPLLWPPFNATIGDSSGSAFIIGELNMENSELAKEVAKLYREGFPELFSGPYEKLHHSQEYRELENMKIFTLQDTRNDRLASVWAITPSEQNMSVEYTATVTHPEYRGRGLCRGFTEAIDKLVEGAGTELGYVYCATFHTATQKIFANLGFKKEAILRGFILAYAGNNTYSRDNVMLMSKLYGDAPLLCPADTHILQ
ncbi:MAG: GNAT family N-acetyltransferase [Candidatus Aenigmarchaeota archaeon]|nr:GNAT family N-acetyltransferase [Candidatus Aenigmarchaeota archaeon]